MSALKLSEPDLKAWLAKGVSAGKIARDMGMDARSLRKRIKRILNTATPAVQEPPPALRAVDALLAERKAKYHQKALHEAARQLIPVTVHDKDPIGIVVLGDTHLDDDGTDLADVERHMQIIRKTAGMYAASAGDHSNCWVGRLARLYAEQSTSAEEAWQLVEWFIDGLAGKIIFLIGGNHDAFLGAGDPIKWISRQHNALYQSSEVRLELCFPNGDRVRVNARHDHAGKSIYNPAHGVMKAATWGTRDHIIIAGHKHISGYGVLKDPESGRTCHSIQVGSFKVYDRYARERGFRDQTLSPSATIIINPVLPETHPDKIKLFWQPEEGAAYLTWLRSRV